jgi:hypothetical protein
LLLLQHPAPSSIKHSSIKHQAVTEVCRGIRKEKGLLLLLCIECCREMNARLEPSHFSSSLILVPTPRTRNIDFWGMIPSLTMK